MLKPLLCFFEGREYDCFDCISLHIPNVVRGCLARVGRGSYTNTFTIPHQPAFPFSLGPHPARFDPGPGQIVDIDWCLAESAGPSLAMMLPKGSIDSQGCPGEQFNWFNFL